MKTRILGLALVAAMASGAALAQRSQPSMEKEDPMNPRNAVREGSQPQIPRQYDKPFPTGMNWVAVTLNGKPLGASRERPSFVLDDQMRARGYGGCNNFTVVAYPLKQQKMIVGPIAHTRMACDKAAEAQERAFFEALRLANEWDYDAGKLVLKGQRGQLQFERGI
ncbi:META domain-containing protein [Terrarubrum flagellatum]|uniref:META domain-containing protein n=1 Tax=Terrirubrum flagellatum TaxID=2895980 RepID=UPI0031454C6A